MGRCGQLMSKYKTIQYDPDSTILSRLNPLTNGVLLIAVTTTLLFSIEPTLQTVFLLSLAILVNLSKIRILRLQGVKFLIVTGGFIGLTQILFFHQGDVLFSIVGLSIYTEAVSRAFVYSTRFISVILVSYLFVISTDPNALVYALMQIGLPYRFGFALINSLRMLPISHYEIQRIHIAQVSRGARYRFFPFKKFVEQITRFLQVLIISLLKRVDTLVYSLEGRSFGIHNRRTFLKKNQFRGVDWFIIFSAVILLTTNILIRNL